MTRSVVAHERIEDLRPRPRVLAPDVRLAPESAVLAVLDDAVCTALVALVAAHPLLDHLPNGREPLPLRRARTLARRALALRDAISAYRRAVFGDFDLLDDDIQF